MGLRFVAYTLPTSATFEKKFDIVDALSGSGVRALSEYSDESIALPSSSDLIDSIVTDTEGSWIRVYDGSQVVDEFRADRVAIPEARPSVRQISGPQRNGLVEGIAIYPKDWPEDKEGAQDWEWGYSDIMPDLSLAALGSIREQWEIWHDHTSGQWNVDVDGDNVDIDHDATADEIEGESETLSPPGSGLQGLTTVDDVTVSGEGTEDTPYVITFYAPPAPSVTITAGTLSGGTTFTATQTVAGGLDPSPITQSKPVDQGSGDFDYGTYGDPPIEVDTTVKNTGSDWSLKVNAVDGGHPGSQIVLDVTPGRTYSAIKIPLRPTVDGNFIIVVNDIFENRVAQDRNNSFTAGSFQDLTLSDVSIPDGVNQIILRAATDDDNTDPHYVDWEGATFIEGSPEATFTQIVGELLDAAHDRGTATFLELDATDAADSNGTALDPISFAVFFGGNAHMGHVLGDGAESGYAWRVVDAANAKVITPTGSHVLQIFKATNGEIEDQTSSAGGASITVGGHLESAETIRRIPPYTTILSHGAGSLTREDTDSTAETNMGRIERVLDAEPLGTDTELSAFNTARFAEESANRKAATAVVLESDSSRPLVDYEEGSKVWWNFGSNLAKEARVVKRVAWTHGEVARYEVQGSSRLTPEAAMAKAVDHLLNQPVRRRGQGGGLKASDLASLTPKGGPYIFIAASDASPQSKLAAWKVCDGTDDQDEWNEAIETIGPYAGTVLGSEGTFNMSGSVVIDYQGLTLRGSGADATYFEAQANDVVLVEWQNYPDFAIENLSLVDAETGGAADHTGVVGISRTSGFTGNAATDLLVRRCHLKFLTGGAFYDDGASGKTMERANFAFNEFFKCGGTNGQIELGGPADDVLIIGNFFWEGTVRPIWADTDVNGIAGLNLFRDNTGTTPNVVQLTEIHNTADNSVGETYDADADHTTSGDHGSLTGLDDPADHPWALQTTGGGKGTVNVVAASGATETLDLSDGNDHDVTLTDNCTLTLTGATNGVACYMTILLRQDGTGSRTVTWPASVEWVGGSAPTLQTAADAWDLVVLVTYDGGTTWFAQHAGTGSGTTTVEGAGEILISDTPSTPLVFADLLQNEAQNDLVYAD